MADSPTPQNSAPEANEEQRVGEAFLNGFASRCEEHGVTDLGAKQQLVDAYFAAQPPPQQ